MLRCNNNLMFSQPRQILILRDTPLPMSFLCLSPSYRCHIPSTPLPPPAIIFPPGLSTMRRQLQPCWHTGSAGASACFSLSCSICLSVCLSPVSPWICMFLSRCVSVYTSVLSFSSSPLSTSAPMGVSFPFCPTTDRPSGSFYTLAAPYVPLFLLDFLVSLFSSSPSWCGLNLLSPSIENWAASVMIVVTAAEVCWRHKRCAEWMPSILIPFSYFLNFRFSSSYRFFAELWRLFSLSHWDKWYQPQKDSAVTQLAVWRENSFISTL